MGRPPNTLQVKSIVCLNLYFVKHVRSFQQLRSVADQVKTCFGVALLFHGIFDTCIWFGTSKEFPMVNPLGALPHMILEIHLFNSLLACSILWKLQQVKRGKQMNGQILEFPSLFVCVCFLSFHFSLSLSLSLFLLSKCLHICSARFPKMI